MADELTPLTTRLAQGLKGPHPALITGSPRLDALTNPGLFLGEFFIKQCVVARLFRQRLLPIDQISFIITCPGAYLATVELDNVSGNVLQQGAIVSDKHQSAGVARSEEHTSELQSRGQLVC